ncbi:MAG: DNA-directed RNA polymerase subunit P [Methanonatronarchaeia archaeon]|nr:MAG: DNA-directed RNA polymerase subunit P [Methanonatronarchaeia archaeon]
MGYRCARCSEDVELDQERTGVRCPFCGYRILTKKRGANPKYVKAR